MRVVGFLITFLLAWFALDQLAPNPPMPLTAGLALAVGALVVALGEVIVFGARPAELIDRMGFGRPAARGLAAAGIVSGVILVVYLVAGSSVAGVALQPDWLLIFVGVLIFNGLAEEMVWRGYAFGRLREGRTFWRAVLLSMPLIALTHVPIWLSNGPVIGILAIVAAAITCLPMAYLYERAGRTIWAAALLHAAVDAWQMLVRPVPDAFTVVVLVVSIFLPLLAFLFRDRFFGAAIPPATGSQTLRFALPERQGAATTTAG